ncbi:hypothetical protein B0T10DRAFT_320330 [Thelonectria olida]|uniref:Uncharacterized protein n=1 Tax=Thelonectria olida TaxID=1576542 RepID=A0A9P9AML7_9HYPO|nr:hypothetical protein B0T10DRAFT_320330 [Thelonectria olida]
MRPALTSLSDNLQMGKPRGVSGSFNESVSSPPRCQHNHVCRQPWRVHCWHHRFRLRPYRNRGVIENHGGVPGLTQPVWRTKCRESSNIGIPTQTFIFCQFWPCWATNRAPVSATSSQSLRLHVSFDTDDDWKCTLRPGPDPSAQSRTPMRPCRMQSHHGGHVYPSISNIGRKRKSLKNPSRRCASPRGQRPYLGHRGNGFCQGR